MLSHKNQTLTFLKDVKIYEEMQERLALLKIFALSTKSKDKKKYKSVESSFDVIRKKINHRKSK